MATIMSTENDFYQSDSSPMETLNITRDTLYEKGDIRITDNAWTYAISLVDRFDDIPLNEKRIRITVSRNELMDMTHAPDEQPHILLPNDTDYEISYEALFLGCRELVDISSLRDWDMSKVSNTKYMFACCTSLSDFSPIRDWDMSKVSNMSGMFMACFKLTDLTAFSRWKLSACVDTTMMFSGCCRLTTLHGLDSWQTSMITSMSGMFADCYYLNDISGVRAWDVSNVEYMDAMFDSCNLTDLTALESWDVRNCVNMDVMFRFNLGLSNVTSLSNWRFVKLETQKRIFHCCVLLGDDPLVHKWAPDCEVWILGYNPGEQINESEIQRYKIKCQLACIKEPLKYCMHMYSFSNMGL